jgi:hypothetical protein
MLDGPPAPSSGALLGIARLFAPRWLEVRGCVIRNETYDPGRFEAEWLASGANRRTVELTFNRARLADEVDDPDDEILREVGLLLVGSWRATLHAAFPGREFDVELVSSSDPAGPEVWAVSHDA